MNDNYEKKFTDEEIELAKDVSLSRLASDLGYTVIRKGKYFSLKEMDSVMIYDDRTWYRWSERGGKISGTTIDFVMEFTGKSFIESADYILDNFGIKKLSQDERKKIISENKIVREKKKTEEKKEMILPEKNPDGYKRAYAYLIKTRCIAPDVVDFFVREKMMYEDKEHHNIIFLGYDKDKNVRYATKKGTYELNGKSFRGDVQGNDKNYGVNIVNKNSDTVNVFEAVIDMMSFCTLANEKNATNKIALGMVSDAPLENFLKENPQIKKINFWLDNDEPGRKAAENLQKKYSELGYFTRKYFAPEGKDVNEYLQINTKKKYENNLKTVENETENMKSEVEFRRKKAIRR